MKLRKMKRSIMGFSLIVAMGVSLFPTGTGVLPTVKAAERDEAGITFEEANVGGETTSEEKTVGEAATSSDADKWDVTEPEGEVVVEDILGVDANSVRIDASNFPDENFRKYIKESFDANNDDIVDDIENITSISVLSRNIYSLKGIEYFRALQELDCSGNKLTSLDVSKNTALTSLLCSGNKLTSLDVSKNTALTSLLCSGNKLTSLDVSKCMALWWLKCSNNKLTSLDVSKCTALKEVWCGNNELASLDVSKCTALESLLCENNELTSLDVSKCAALEALYCNNNELTSLDVSKNTALKDLPCDNNKLTSLDVSKNMALKYLLCDNNKLTSLDMSKNTALVVLYCNNNELTSLDVSKNTALKYLGIDSNITTDISVLNLNTLSLYVPQVKGSIDLSNITCIEKYMSGLGWNADTKKLTYELIDCGIGIGLMCQISDRIQLHLGNVGRFSSYQGYDFDRDVNGNVRCYDSNGNPVINEFKCDGTYTYYFQLDGTAMRNRLTYHPDGKHVIYFDENGHEVFSNFHHVEKSIAGEAVDDLCFFDVYGYMYVDVMTYDQAGEKLYYVNPYGVIEQGKWFEFSDTCVWAGTTNKVGKGYGYANADGTLMINAYTYDWLGRYVYLQGNGHMH